MLPYIHWNGRFSDQKSSSVSVVRVLGTNGGLNGESVWLIWLVALCGALSVMQAACFDRLSFDPFPLF
ncbi:MAG: hypothetical protein ACI86S_000928 [Paracoccaceae bacterium]|jgi:hypothetical protein